MTDIVNFKNFDDFFRRLIKSIEDGKDVYVFRYTLTDETDYQIINEDNCDNYYVHWCIDFNKLQENLSIIFSDEEDVHLVLDYVFDINQDDEQVTYQRLFIFRSK